MRFQIGKQYITNCWFTGARQLYVYEGGNLFKVIANELDGSHERKEEHEICTDENGEYILLYEYHGHEKRLYA